MKSINPYLNFPGSIEEALDFHRKFFSGDFGGDVTCFTTSSVAEIFRDAIKI